MMADEEEVVRALGEPIEMRVAAQSLVPPREGPEKDFRGAREWILMFNNEFRARLSFTMSPFPSSICFSNALIDSMAS